MFSSSILFSVSSHLHYYCLLLFFGICHCFRVTCCFFSSCSVNNDTHTHTLTYTHTPTHTHSPTHTHLDCSPHYGQASDNSKIHNTRSRDNFSLLQHIVMH